MAAREHDPKDDVDRLFACFKCGVSPPQSAFRERPRRAGKRSRVASAADCSGGGGCSSSTPTPDSAAEKYGAPSSAAIKFTGRRQMSPVVFYGSPQGVPVKRPLSLLRLLREIRIDLKKQTDLVPSAGVWATFPRQEEAIRFCKAHEYTNVFSYQDHLSGQRRFLVSTYDEFWKRYNNMDPQIRHHYEVIQDGSPCHIYFDLEFDPRLNKMRDPDEMVDILVAVTFSALHDKYSIEGQEEWIIELDSSTEEKFSRHLIIRIPKTAFKDNSHVGAFISEICSRIAAQRAANPNFEKLYITKDRSCTGPSDHLFMDTAVYSRNRCFRLAFSSKSGKKSFLVATGRFKYKNMNDKELFMKSLICRLDDDCDKLLTCKLDLDCKKTLQFDSEASMIRIQGRNKDSIGTYRSDFPVSNTYGISPFPALDGFIESIASFGNVSGKIRCWYWFSHYGLMIYSMSRSRYCEHIGREHKSNHVMYIVEFQRAAYYQKCYDPDCQGYRSPLRAVPWDVIPELSSISDSAQREYQGEVVAINIEGSNRNEYISNGTKSVFGSGEDDPSWWEEAVKFADSIENTDHADHAPGSCDQEENDSDDADWWMDAERIMVQIEEQIGSQSNT
ncbi:DNA-directed primase/polymerase protein [Oryza brachyantha]|uniref:DNA-directed primase/polymerase protein n=1 Tax=Oryza brachyantha TaxID=4533 RepID=J3MKP4_ORYBR|nr:DNA-directed primase/polymerase protein [Oryza brachyantha]